MKIRTEIKYYNFLLGKRSNIRENNSLIINQITTTKEQVDIANINISMCSENINTLYNTKAELEIYCHSNYKLSNEYIECQQANAILLAAQTRYISQNQLLHHSLPSLKKLTQQPTTVLHTSRKAHFNKLKQLISLKLKNRYLATNNDILKRSLQNEQAAVNETYLKESNILLSQHLQHLNLASPSKCDLEIGRKILKLNLITESLYKFIPGK